MGFMDFAEKATNGMVDLMADKFSNKNFVRNSTTDILINAKENIPGMLGYKGLQEKQKEKLEEALEYVNEELNRR